MTQFFICKQPPPTHSDSTLCGDQYNNVYIYYSSAINLQSAIYHTKKLITIQKWRVLTLLSSLKDNDSPFSPFRSANLVIIISNLVWLPLSQSLEKKVM